MFLCHDLPVWWVVPRVLTFVSLTTTYLEYSLYFALQLSSPHTHTDSTSASVFIVELRSNTGSWARSMFGSEKATVSEWISVQSSALSEEMWQSEILQICCKKRKYFRNSCRTSPLGSSHTHLAKEHGIHSWKPDQTNATYKKGLGKAFSFSYQFFWIFLSAKYLFSVLYKQQGL